MAGTTALQDPLDTMLRHLREAVNSAVRGNVIRFFTAKAYGEGQISLYDAYLLHGEALDFHRKSYTAPVCPRMAGYSDLLSLLNMKMMALLFRDGQAAELWEKYAVEALRLCRERPRRHYIANAFSDFLRAERQPERLNQLLD